MSTGFYADIKGGTKVHFVNNVRPLCGFKTKKHYQWCSSEYQWDYIECENCKRIRIKQSEKEIVQRKKK